LSALPSPQRIFPRSPLTVTTPRSMPESIDETDIRHAVAVGPFHDGDREVRAGRGAVMLMTAGFPTDGMKQGGEACRRRA
jgi:hypothetical protein